MKIKINASKRVICANIISRIVRLLGMTLRVRIEGMEKIENLPQGKILMSWHGRSFVGGQFFRNRGYWVVISNSNDGDIQNKIFKTLGYGVIRGSSGRGGERALLESIRELRKGATLAMTPDGPRGPSGVLQDGVLMMARKSGAVLVPIGVSATPRYLVKSWDSHMVPFPFAKCLMLVGDPIYIDAQASTEEIAQIKDRVQLAIHAIQEQAELQNNERRETIKLHAGQPTP